MCVLWVFFPFTFFGLVSELVNSTGAELFRTHSVTSEAQRCNLGFRFFKKNPFGMWISLRG